MTGDLRTYRSLGPFLRPLKAGSVATIRSVLSDWTVFSSAKERALVSTSSKQSRSSLPYRSDPRVKAKLSLA